MLKRLWRWLVQPTIGPCTICKRPNVENKICSDCHMEMTL
jgi:hypothetical protein